MLSRRSILIAAIAATTIALNPAFATSPQAFDAKAFADAQHADSEARRPPIPTESGHPIRGKAATDSDRRRPPCG